MKMITEVINDGHFFSLYPNGNIQIVANYSNGKKNSYFEEFYENGGL
jgi:antitoxin component YwqK of YwqJK toxin-antitoxin module